MGMKIKLRPDKAVRARKIRLGRVPTLVLKPASQPDIPVSTLWFHGRGYVTRMREMVYMSRAGGSGEKLRSPFRCRSGEPD